MTKTTTTTITAKQITNLRDDQLLSWARVAEALSLGSPGAARRLYSSLVRPHDESVLPGRTPGYAKVQPVHLADADLATIRRSRRSASRGFRCGAIARRGGSRRRDIGG